MCDSRRPLEGADSQTLDPVEVAWSEYSAALALSRAPAPVSFERRVCGDCGAIIERHTEAGWSQEWYHLPAQVETLTPHPARG